MESGVPKPESAEEKPSTHEEVVTPEQYEQALQRHIQCRDRVDEITKRAYGYSSFRDIAPQLLTIGEAMLSKDFGAMFRTPQQYKELMLSLDCLERYLRLLDEYPEFSEYELGKVHHYQDVRDQSAALLLKHAIPSRARYYVDELDKRLHGN